jgi:cell division septal protein FtsQ
MEIKTSRKPKETEGAEPLPAPEKSMYLRRKPTQQVRKSYSGSRVFIRTMKWIGKLSLACLAVSFFVSVLVYAFTSDEFTVQKVSVIGCNQIDPAGLERLVSDEFPSHILRIDLKKLRSRLVEKETWCRGAEIRRILPSELVIYVEERKPTVVLEIKGELYLADSDGILLDKYESRYGKMDVPVFKGLLGEDREGYRLSQAENAERVRLGIRIMKELESGSPEFTRGISEVDLSDKANARIMLVDDTAEVFLGDREYLKRFQTLMSNMKQYQELKSTYTDVASVDLRFDGQIIYRPRKVAASGPGGANPARP